MAMQAALAEVQETRRNALVDYYIAYCVPDTPIDGSVPLSDRVKTPDDLYEYLLLDTQITAAVDTSQVAEAISSVQLYINRCLGGYDPDVDNAPGSTMVLESKPGGFLYDWDTYNQVYSTWAGKERLQYYPSVYLNPDLRYNKTELFNALEETINQGRISSTRVNAGFEQYMLGFDALTNLEIISGYQAGSGDEATADCQDTLYLIGRTPTEPYSYYWRSCNMAVRNDQGNFTYGAWSQWLKIEAPTSDALNGYISPCWSGGCLYLCWLSRTENGAAGADVKTPTYQYYVNLWVLREDGGWGAARKLTCPQTPYQGDPVTMFAVADSSGENLFMYGTDSNNTIYFFENGYFNGDARYGGFSGTLIQSNRSSKMRLNYEMNNFPIPITDCDGSISGYILFSGPDSVKFYADCSKPANNPKVKGVLLFADGTQSEPLDTNIWFNWLAMGAIGFKLAWRPDSDSSWVYSDSYSFHAGELSKKGFSLGTDAVSLYKNGAAVFSIPTSTASPKYFARRLQLGISALLSYETQTTPIEQGGLPIDFNGAYGLYFWEIFFHSSFLIADRYLNEQNYADAALWYRYIFAPTGYRNQQGELETIDGETRYWNVVPLQQDHTWNTAIPPTDDPDVIAMNDPMHYKMAIFLNTINQLIEQGDSAYRMLQRDYLAQAKMCYLQASQLLGPRPEIEYNASWPNPTVAAESQEIVVMDSDDPNAGSPTYLTQALRAFLAEQNGDFLPPYNADLLEYWDKLEIRFYNLRHNLSLDGQPLSLPLYADPVSPADLQRQHGAGNGAGGNSVSNTPLASQFRFPVLLEKARGAVGSVIQFGASLQGALDRRDNENMTLLLQNQQQQVLTLTQEIQNNNIAVQQDALTALQASLNGAKTRLSHYENLYNNWVSSSEENAMNLRTAAGGLYIAAQPLQITAGGLETVPNVFGLACGGSRFAGPVQASASVLTMAAQANEQAAVRLDISEQYRRRRQDWQIQRDNAASEVSQLEAQIQSQTQQIAMAQKQLNLAKQELANQQAVYDLQTTRFTGAELFNWMSGRLSSLYYQLYDVTLSLCLACKAALVREIGADRAGNLFVTPMWNDLYQGLLAGEGLQLELQRMDNTYLKDDKRGLEILKTVSLNTQISKADSATNFQTMLSAVLAGESPAAKGGVEMSLVDTDKLLMTLQIDTLGLKAAYGANGKVGRLKNISVTLPALLGPYQNVEATLAHSSGTYVALSRGLDDSGLFVVDFNDPKYLPFEGDPVDSGTLSLTFFHAGKGGSQQALVESLVDVIYQIRYTLKDY